MTFQEKIVRLRKIRGLTQDEFASAVGVSRQAVYKWESGQSYPEVAKLLEIKMLFGISIDDLLDDTYEVVMPEKKKKKKISRTVAEGLDEKIRARIGEASSLEIAESLSRAAASTEEAEQAQTPDEASEPVQTVLESDAAGAEEPESVAEAVVGAESVGSPEEPESAGPAPVYTGTDTCSSAAQDEERKTPQNGAEPQSPAPVYQNPAEKEQQQAAQDEEAGKKRGFFSRLFGKK